MMILNRTFRKRQSLPSILAAGLLFLFLHAGNGIAGNPCGELLELWRGQVRSHCTNLPTYSVLDLAAQVNQTCYCPTENLALTEIHYNNSGIQSPDDGVFTANGQFLYTISAADYAIGVFARNSADGNLSPVQTIWPQHAALQGLDGIEDFQLSPDEKNGYAVSIRSNALVVFQRDLVTGALTFLETIQDLPRQLATDGMYRVLISPNGKHVYVKQVIDGKARILLYNRAADNGRLTFESALEQTPAGLPSFSEFIISPDGVHLYVSEISNGDLRIFGRDPNTGYLALLGKHLRDRSYFEDLAFSADGLLLHGQSASRSDIFHFERDPVTGFLTGRGNASVSSLNDPAGIVTVNDGQTIYTVGSGHLKAFRSDENTGLFQEFQTIRNGYDGVNIPGLWEASAILMDPTEGEVLVFGHLNNSIVRFSRDSQSGQLSLIETVDANDLNPNHLESHEQAAVSPDGRHLYAGTSKEKVAIYERDLQTGRLTFLGVNDPHPELTDRVWHNQVSVHPNGRFVYTTALTGNGYPILIFSRDQEDGSLAFLQSYAVGTVKEMVFTADGRFFYAKTWNDVYLQAYAVDPETGGLQIIDNLEYDLSRISDFSLSPDDRHIYVMNQSSGKLTTFERNTDTGQLTEIDVLWEDHLNTMGLDDAARMVISPDGAFVYFGSSTTTVTSIFERSPDTGLLSFVTKTPEDNRLFNRLSNMVMHPSGDYLYYTGDVPNLLVFARDNTTGALELLNNRLFTPSIKAGQPLRLMISPDGKSMYASHLFERSLALFTIFP